MPRRRASAPGTAARSEGLLRNLVVREGRRTGELQVRLVTSPGELDADCADRRRRRRRPVLDADRRARRDARRAARPTLLPGHASDRASALGDLRFRDLARGVLPDEHRDGRGALRRRARVRRPARLRARLRPLLRHRHDRPRRSPPRAGEVWGVEIVEAAVADAIDNARAQRDHQRALLRRRHPARDARARRARPAGPTSLVVDPPRAGPLAEGRAPDRRGRAEARSSTSPATRRRSRRTPPSSSRPATRCAACARSTCSRRRRTSSASRCSSAASAALRRPQDRLDVEDRRAVDRLEVADAHAPALDGEDLTRCRPIGFGRSGERVANTPRWGRRSRCAGGRAARRGRPGPAR